MAQKPVMNSSNTLGEWIIHGLPRGCFAVVTAEVLEMDRWRDDERWRDEIDVIDGYH